MSHSLGTADNYRCGVATPLSGVCPSSPTPPPTSFHGSGSCADPLVHNAHTISHMMNNLGIWCGGGNGFLLLCSAVVFQT